jgi:hypothetical protein
LGGGDMIFSFPTVSGNPHCPVPVFHILNQQMCTIFFSYYFFLSGSQVFDIKIYLISLINSFIPFFSLPYLDLFFLIYKKNGDDKTLLH